MKSTLLLFKRAVLTIAVLFLPVCVFSQTQINNEAELRAIANDLAGNYMLAADITVTGDWTPIGTDAAPFTGTINGNGKVIKGLSFSDKVRNGVGFIGSAKGATITKLALEEVFLEGNQDVGGIVGRSFAPVFISECYVSGVIKALDHVGSIVGGTRASDPKGQKTTISNCFSTAAIVSTAYQSGGILGTSIDAEVSNNFFAGFCMNGNANTGGIVALLDTDSETNIITNNVSTATFLRGGATNTHRILGNIDGKPVNMSNNYAWDQTVLYGAGAVITVEEANNNINSTDGLAKTTAELQISSFYTGDLGWSATTWKIENGKFPVLSYQTLPIDAIYVPLEVTKTTPGNTIDALSFSAVGKTITYSSSNPSVASIGTDGQITCNAVGNVTLTFSTASDASSRGVTITKNLEVADIALNITNETQLREIRYRLNGDFTLMNDIAVTGTWEPIANFTGTLNGNGKIISGLKYDNPNTDKVGLFKNTLGGKISKLGIEDAYFVGNADVGAIAGELRGTTVEECYVANSYIAGRDHIGSITGAMRINEAGATVEEKNSKIINCYASAVVYSRQYQAGGLVGIIDGGNLVNSYYSGMISCPGSRACGLVSLVDGDNAGTIANCVNLAPYIIGNATNRIVDKGDRTATVLSNNYSLKESLLGINQKLAGQREVFDTSGSDGSDVNNDNLTKGSTFYSGLGWDFSGVWKTLSEGDIYPVLKWQNTPIRSTVFNIPDPAYVKWNSEEEDGYILLSTIKGSLGQSFNFTADSDEFVEIDNIDKVLYPTSNELTQNGSAKITISNLSAVGDQVSLLNTEFTVDVYVGDVIVELWTPEDIMGMERRLMANFRLMANIDMKGYEFKGLGSDSNPFTGELDGNGYAIKNITLNAANVNKKGFFNVSSGATIKNLGLLNFTLNAGAQDIGGFVGKAERTTISQCYFTGKVVGNDHVGALVGGDNGNVKIENSYANAHVETTSSQVGGLIGTMNGNCTIDRCYFTGNVVAPVQSWQNNAGGIVSLLEKMDNANSVTSTVSIGNVTGGTVAYFVARGDKYTPEGGDTELMIKLREFSDNIYFIGAVHNKGEVEQTGYEVQSDGRSIPTPEMARTAQQLKQQSTYAAIGWDFSNIWSINEGNAYPALQIQKVTASVDPVCTEKYSYVVYTSSDNLYISGINETAQVSLFNMQGQMIFNSVVSDNQAVKLPYKGLYIVRIVENGQAGSVKVINR